MPTTSKPIVGPPETIRATGPSDLTGLDMLLQGLDEQSRYRRWFSGGTDVHRAAAWAAHPADCDSIGLVALAPGGEVIGHAAAIPMADGRAEVCFEVAAARRQHGVAGRLLDELVVQAHTRGLRTLVAEVLSENRDMLAVMREHGATYARRDGSVVELELAVDPPSITNIGAPPCTAPS